MADALDSKSSSTRVWVRVPQPVPACSRRLFSVRAAPGGERFLRPIDSMQSFILGAGLGMRLRPLTAMLPKPLMPVFQRPLVHHILDYHYKAGVRDFTINISHLALMWPRAFPEESWHGFPLHFSREEQALDSGGGVKRIMPRVSSDSPLLVQNGDVLTDLSLRELLETHRRGGWQVTLALRSVDGNRNVGFDPGSGRVTDMRHALRVNPGTHQFAGVYVMESSVAALFPKDEVFSIVPVWLELIRRGQVGGAVFDHAEWHEIGTPASYLDSVLDTSSAQRIHPTARISGEARLSQDCSVGAGASVEAGAELFDCVVWPRTHVRPGLYKRCILTPRLVVQA